MCTAINQSYDLIDPLTNNLGTRYESRNDDSHGNNLIDEFKLQ